MKLTRLFFFLMIVGISAIATRAQAPEDPSDTAGDPTVRYDASTCPSGDYCYTFTLTSPITIAYCDPLTLLTDPAGCPVPSGDSAPIVLPVGPPGYINVPPYYVCASDNLGQQVATGTINVPITIPPTGTFTGCNFADGTVSGTVVVSSNAPFTAACTATNSAELGNCTPGSDITFIATPEPRTSLLFMSGLVLISIGGIARKRLRTAFRT